MPDLPIIQFLVYYAILLFSLSFHEAAHAITAKWGGDMLSAYQGRITMNPLVHIDPVGTVLMPILQFFTGLPLIGWAKPVPVNSLKFRRPDYNVVVALAGPFSNLILASAGMLVLSLLYIVVDAFAEHLSSDAAISTLRATVEILQQFIFINIALMVFNLTPIPPLDGSHVLWHLVVVGRDRLRRIYFFIAQYSYVVLILLMIFPPYRNLMRYLITQVFEFLAFIFGGFD